LAPAEQTVEDVVRRAEEEFAEGVRLRSSAEKARPHFRAAATYYEELRRRGANNPLLNRNLGNAYLLAGDLPRAVVNYHRGLRLAPADPALRESLARAREMVAYPREGNFGRPPDDARPSWLPALSPRWLFAGALGLYVLACGCLTRWRMVRRGRILAVGVAALLGAGLLGAALLVEQAGRETKRPLVVIAEDDVLLRKGNGLTYPPRYETSLHRGVEARLLFVRGGWLQIELAGGEVGWVPRSAGLVEEVGRRESRE
jgi:hypothetical protein